MTEDSFWWTTGGAGDGSSTYTRVDLLHVAAILAAASHFEGVAPSYLNELVGSVGGANTFNINTGGAIVDGRPYRNDASVGVNIPSTASLERIDRIVARADWTAQTVRITRIAGTESGSPTPPAITQTSQTTYDIKLFQVKVDSGGTVTLELDERDWATISVDDSTIENNDGTLRVKAGGIDTNEIAADAVTQAKIDALAVGLAQIINDSVDDTKVGNRVPMFTRRQGGSATDWATAGNTNYTPTAVKGQGGAKSIGTINAGAEVGVLITFPQTFSYAPVVVCVPYGAQKTSARISGNSSTGFLAHVTNHHSAQQTGVLLNWIAIGPE